MRTHRPDQGSAEPRQGTARPGHGQWPAMDTEALGQAVGALNAAERWRAQLGHGRASARRGADDGWLKADNGLE